MQALQVENISLVREKSILKEISFELNPGEMLIVLGPSGSGKTSLLRCLNRLETVDSGCIFLKGDNISSIRPEDLRRRASMMFQTAALVPSTVRENVFIGPKLHNREMSKGEVDGLLEQVGLPLELWEQDVEALSVGERQRVAVARALITEPAVVLADEPTGNLDRKTGQKVLDLMLQMNTELGSSLVVVTHDMGIAGQMDRVLELDNGLLVEACL